MCTSAQCMCSFGACSAEGGQQGTCMHNTAIFEGRGDGGKT